MPANSTRSPRAAAIPDAIRSAVLSEPWAITDNGLRRVLAVVSRAEMPTSLEQALGQPKEQTRLVTVRNGIATIPVSGVLVRRASWFDAMCGAVDYVTLARELRSVLDDPAVTAVVLHFNTPGGEVASCSELALQIRAGRDIKPIHAYVGDMCCSAGYWLASQCTEIHVSATALTGNLGVRMTGVDASRRLKREGLEVVDIISSETPAKAHDLTKDDGRARCLKIVNDLAAVLFADVAEGRGVDVDAVKEQYGRGAIFVGADAVTHGLADAVTTYEALLASLTAAERGEPHEVTMPASRAGGRKPSRPNAKKNTPAPKASAKPKASEEDKEKPEDADAEMDEDLDDEDDEEEPTASEEGADDADDDDEEQPTDSKASFIARGIAQENARVMGIIGAYSEQFGLSALEPLLADTSCSVEAGAARLLKAKAGKRMVRIGALRGDDASLRNAPRTEPQASTNGLKPLASRMLRHLAQTNPSAAPAAFRAPSR